MQQVIRKISIIFVTILLVSNSLNAQNEIQDLLRQADDIYAESPAESFFYCEEAEALALEMNSNEYVADICLCKARYYLLIAKFDLTEEELNNALKASEKKSDSNTLAHIYSLKSILYEKIGEDRKSHRFILKTLELRRELNDTLGLLGTLSNLSLDYWRLNELDSMRFCLEELASLEDYFREKDRYYFHQNWGTYYSGLMDYDKSLANYFTALEIAESESMTDSKATVLYLIANAYRASEDYSKAEEYALKSYHFSMDNDLIYESTEALGELIYNLEKLGKYKDALQYQKKWIGLESEIYNLEKIQKVKQLEGQINLAEKEKEIAQASADLEHEKLLGEQARLRNLWLYAIVIVVCVLLFFSVFIFLKTKRLNKAINDKNEELELKGMHLEQALYSIHDSLEYSKLIQQAILPSQDLFQQNFKDFFIHYVPKDIVSGDFYWITELNNKTIFAVGDCTGHGVPGAMVSVVCNEALNKVILEKGVESPDLILNDVRDLVVNTFNQSEASLNDGMDIALCAVVGNRIQFAGAQNSVWIIRKGDVLGENKSNIRIEKSENNVYSLIELKGDKQPIGKYIHSNPFTLKEFILQPGDAVYLFSDGYADQFGGENLSKINNAGKKFKTTNFKKLLFSIQHLTMQQQNERLEIFFKTWKGELEQIDDVCVIGVRV